TCDGPTCQDRALAGKSSKRMATPEDITRRASVGGILPDGLITISDVRWIGTVAIEVTHRDSASRLGNELLFSLRRPSLQMGLGSSQEAARFAAQAARATT